MQTLPFIVFFSSINTDDFILFLCFETNDDLIANWKEKSIHTYVAKWISSEQFCFIALRYRYIYKQKTMLIKYMMTTKMVIDKQYQWVVDDDDDIDEYEN